MISLTLPSFVFLGLLDLANSYCESQLKRLCERVIKQGITIDNAAMLYAAAIKYEAKVRNNYFTELENSGRSTFNIQVWNSGV